MTIIILLSNRFKSNLLFAWILLLMMNGWWSAHAQEHQQLSEDQCSFCADGSVPATSGSTTTTSFPISSKVSLTCQDLPTNAITLLNFGLTNSDFQCEVSQLWAYEYCGCPTPPDVRPCWICRDGDENYDKDRWVPGSAGSGSGAEGTCGFQAYFSGLRYDHFGRATDSVESKCPHMTWGMDSWCGCPAESVTQPECTLCGNGKTSLDPCRTNPLAAKLHKVSGQPVGPNLGTCQYYDWMVERLQGPQCDIFEEDSSIQFDEIDVRSFCCEDNELEVVGVSLCGVNDLAVANTKAQSVIPSLGHTCFEVAEAARWLQTETILVDTWSGTNEDGVISLREFCCNNDTEWDSSTSVSTTETPAEDPICQAIPRAQYDKSSSNACTHATFSAFLIISLPGALLAWCWI